MQFQKSIYFLSESQQWHLSSDGPAQQRRELARFQKQFLHVCAGACTRLCFGVLKSRHFGWRVVILREDEVLHVTHLRVSPEFDSCVVAMAYVIQR